SLLCGVLYIRNRSTLPSTVWQVHQQIAEEISYHRIRIQNMLRLSPQNLQGYQENEMTIMNQSKQFLYPKDQMQHALEDKKRCLKLAESFAETEISTLETKMERKESTLKLVQRFSDAEITRLEDEVNECLHLKYVLEAEVAFLSALTALDGLQNTVSSLQKRVKELEAIISRKHWSMNFTQLDGSNIVFYVPWNDSQPTKDYPHGKPELIVPLLRCKIKKDCTDYTSKKNTFVLKTSDKMLLLQADNETDMQKWFLHIQRKITELGGHPDMTGSSLLVPKKMVKQVADRFVKKRLRPLETKGIVNDAIFGGDIKEICSKEKSEVPMFLVKCIDAIESRGERYDLGDKQWDIHVLCGILLLFFRKLKNRLFEESLCETVMNLQRENKMGVHQLAFVFGPRLDFYILLAENVLQNVC
ncbi:RHG27-like protein, partial [Mya arenaria]